MCVQAMLQRLEKVQPVYRISDWIDDWQKSEELTQRITAYPPPRTPVSFLTHLYEFYRVCVCVGVYVRLAVRALL